MVVAWYLGVLIFWFVLCHGVYVKIEGGLGWSGGVLFLESSG